MDAVINLIISLFVIIVRTFIVFTYDSLLLLT